MTTQPTFNLRSIRVLLVTVALALAGAVGFAASDVSAFVSAPTVSTGGAGGGGFGSQIDETARAQNLNALTGGGFADQVNERARAQSLDELTSGAVAEQASSPLISAEAF